jgi:hypothetical protein
MATTSDPYRTLGLDRSASLADVRTAYRRLAKANHPDAAGEAALPRFLAIQAAYDEITGFDGAFGPTGRPRASRRPWDADPDRANATHRAYGGRARATGRERGRSTAPGGRPAGGGPTADRTAGTGASGSTGERPPHDPSTDPPRPPNKATPGSTSYDGVDAGPFEPDWGGASWYGTSSGTYWTLNPKEYADPRKHGPEYQARARRASAEAPVDPPTIDTNPNAADPIDPSPSATTGSWWDATAGVPPDGPASAADTDPNAGSDATETDLRSPAATPDREAPWRAWPLLEGEPRTLIERVGRAIVGWIPIALLISAIAGDVSGCARFSAECDPIAAPVTWALQAVVLIALILAPILASVAATGAVVAMGASVPAAVALSSAGAELGDAGSDPSAAGIAVVSIAVLAWLVGSTVGLIRAVRRRGHESPPRATA